MTTISVSLAGITISREDALELANRMNANWPGKFWLVWTEAPYMNNAINPFMPEYHGQSAHDGART